MGWHQDDAAYPTRACCFGISRVNERVAAALNLAVANDH
jgi:hypothetical protein